MSNHVKPIFNGRHDKDKIFNVQTDSLLFLANNHRYDLLFTSFPFLRRIRTGRDCLSWKDVHIFLLIIGGWFSPETCILWMCTLKSCWFNINYSPPEIWVICSYFTIQIFFSWAVAHQIWFAHKVKGDFQRTPLFLFFCFFWRVLSAQPPPDSTPELQPRHRRIFAAARDISVALINLWPLNHSCYPPIKSLIGARGRKSMWTISALIGHKIKPDLH